MLTQIVETREATGVQLALDAAQGLLSAYQAVAPACCYHYARAELSRLQGEAREARTHQALRQLSDRVWRQKQALEQAICEWRSDEFYSLEEQGHGESLSSER